MRSQFNVHEAKSQLSKLLERVEAGEEIVIARNGRPVATLVATQPDSTTPRRGRGAWRGKVDMSRFDALDPEIAREFERDDA
jgi:prevent-host-death family protein